MEDIAFFMFYSSGTKSVRDMRHQNDVSKVDISWSTGYLKSQH